MPAEPTLSELAIHASAVAIGGRALLILGPSRSGKSRLTVALVGASTRRRRIVLLGDDRILLRGAGTDLVARPHPRIAGFVERRGLGIVAMPFAPSAPLAAVVELGAAEPCDDPLENFPRLRIVNSPRSDLACDEACQRVLDWWERDLRVTPAAESGPVAPAPAKN